jgi:competence ComEA-like helix-hairpin-helix protein
MKNQPLVTKSNFRAGIVLLVVLTFVFVLPDLIVYFSPRAKMSFEELSEPEREAFLKVKRNGKKNYSFRNKISRYNSPPVKFNPNNYTAEEWMALGLSEKQAAVILKFTKRKLRSNEDLKKIFVINEELYDLIKDSTYYDQNNQVAYENQKHTPSKKLIIKVNLNTSSEEELMNIPGIGAFFAKNIVKTRNELGGFVAIDQLLEVWKVDEQKLEGWKPYLILSPDEVQKVNINTATTEELAAHKYISWNLANSLVKLRLQKGSYKKVEDVKQSVLMTKELFEKLKPYFKTE